MQQSPAGVLLPDRGVGEPEVKRADPPRSRRWALYSSHLGDYMRRWILRTPWGTLRIHNILKSDDGRDFHDHPFHFTSVILRGGYTEHAPGCACEVTRALGAEPLAPCAHYSAPAVIRRRATDLHRLELEGPAWTFVVSSRYLRKWGFQTAAGWVPYDEYERSFYRQ